MLYLSKKIVLFLSIFAQIVVAEEIQAPPQISLTISNTVAFQEVITRSSVDLTMAALIGKRLLLPANETVYLVINSPGGDPDAAIRLLSFIDSTPNVKLICIRCASAASLLFGVSKLKRLILKDSTVLLHEMHYNHFTANMAKNKRLLDQFIKDSDTFNKMIYTVMHMTKDDYESNIINRDWVLESDEILKRNLADQLITVKCDLPLHGILPFICR